MCDFRDIYETELEDAAVKALCLDGFCADTVKSRGAVITIDNAYIAFGLKNGTEKRILREYQKGYCGFSFRLFCGCCGEMFEADNWRMGTSGQKRSIKYGCAEVALYQENLTVHSEGQYGCFS